MARIVHRHRLPSLAPAPGIRRLPARGRLFLALAAVAAAVELWPAVNATWLGVTDVLGEFASVLPTAFRNAAVVGLPAAVVWAQPRARRVNPWLWKGAVIVAVVQLARYPADRFTRALIEAANVGEPGAAVPAFALASVVGLLLAFLTTLGIWALSEGLMDAGARLAKAVIAGLGLAVVGIVVVAFGPSVMAAIQEGGDPLLAVNLASVLVNALYLFSLALLAGRSVAGAIGRLDPRLAWRLGAVAAVSLAVVPVVSLGLTILGSASQTALPEVLFTALRLSVFLGWPLLAVAFASGMGAQPRWVDGFRARRHRLSSVPRVVEGASSPQPSPAGP
jgi:hypothetical protein